MRSVQVDQVATSETFDEEGYLRANPDVARAVEAQAGIRNGRHHFELFGRAEGRRQRPAKALAELRHAKLTRLLPVLRLDLPHRRIGDQHDFLTEALRRRGSVVETDAISCNPYPTGALALIEHHANGLILDCGSGRRDIYYEGVVNLEIVDYDTTDVIAIGEDLPFADASFDAVISIAVLEHVRDPFACAAELARVLKPGGQLFCEVPFLQPLHGFPHHYYNMTHEGLRALFEDRLTIDDQRVESYGLPVWTLIWMLREWSQGLPPEARQEFQSMKVGDLVAWRDELLQKPWVRELSDEKNFGLASLTTLRGHKPAGER